MQLAESLRKSRSPAARGRELKPFANVIVASVCGRPLRAGVS